MIDNDDDRVDNETRRHPQSMFNLSVSLSPFPATELTKRSGVEEEREEEETGSESKGLIRR